jgi:hypothetical protein
LAVSRTIKPEGSLVGGPFFITSECTLQQNLHTTVPELPMRGHTFLTPAQKLRDRGILRGLGENSVFVGHYASSLCNVLVPKY